MKVAFTGKVAIVGSREYGWPEKVRSFVASLGPEVVVVSGGARGVDRIAVEEAKRCRLATIEILADWQGLGKRAGFIRNQQLVDRADRVVAFWDEVSRGTADTIRRAKQVGKLEAVYGACGLLIAV